MSADGPVVVVGGTGNLGGQVIDALQSRGKKVRALVRPTSDASKLENSGVEITRGDLMDPESLERALAGADAVITTAAGYTRHSKGDTPEIDTTGNRNLVDAASAVGIRRFVLTSILTCDKTPQVPHFWHKKLTEDRLEERGVPFVALRPGAFFDQVARTINDPSGKGKLTWVGSRSTRITFVLTSDLARYLAEAVDAPGVEGQRIDIGWDRPVSVAEIADIAGPLLGREIKVRTVPIGLINVLGAVVGLFNPMVKDIAAMFKWFETGGYVADPERQREVFGVPTAEDAIARFLGSRKPPIAG